MSNNESSGSIQENADQIRAIFEGAPDGDTAFTADWLLLRWNPRAEQIFGWTAAEVTGKPLKDTIIPPAYRADHERGLRHFLKTGEGPLLNKIVETRALTKDGREFDVALSISPN